MRVQSLVITFVLFSSLFISRSYANGLKDGPIQFQRVGGLKEIKGKWTAIGGGCVDMERREMALYLGLTHDETLDIDGESFLNVASSRNGPKSTSIGKGTIQRQASKPTLIVDFLANYKKYQGESLVSRSLDGTDAFNVEIYRAEGIYLATRLPPDPERLCSRSGRSFVKFWQQAEVYAF